MQRDTARTLRDESCNNIEKVHRNNWSSERYLIREQLSTRKLNVSWIHSSQKIGITASALEDLTCSLDHIHKLLHILDRWADV